MLEEESPIKEFDINQPAGKENSEEDGDTTYNDLIKQVTKANEELKKNVPAGNENVEE